MLPFRHHRGKVSEGRSRTPTVRGKSRSRQSPRQNSSLSPHGLRYFGSGDTTISNYYESPFALVPSDAGGAIKVPVASQPRRSHGRPSTWLVPPSARRIGLHGFSFAARIPLKRAAPHADTRSGIDASWLAFRAADYAPRLRPSPRMAQESFVSSPFSSILLCIPLSRGAVRLGGGRAGGLSGTCSGRDERWTSARTVWSCCEAGMVAGSSPYSVRRGR